MHFQSDHLLQCLTLNTSQFARLRASQGLELQFVTTAITELIFTLSESGSKMRMLSRRPVTAPNQSSPHTRQALCKTSSADSLYCFSANWTALTSCRGWGTQNMSCASRIPCVLYPIINFRSVYSSPEQRHWWRPRFALIVPYSSEIL